MSHLHSTLFSQRSFFVVISYNIKKSWNEGFPSCYHLCRFLILKKKTTYIHTLPWVPWIARAAIPSLLRGTEERIGTRLSLFICLVWNRLQCAKIQEPALSFLFISSRFFSFSLSSCAKPLFSTRLLPKSAFFNILVCPQFCWKEAHQHFRDTNHRNRGGDAVSAAHYFNALQNYLTKWQAS